MSITKPQPNPAKLLTRQVAVVRHTISGMKKLAAVEEARAMMREGIEWGLWRWLLEKGRVREMADRATAALDEADRRVKATWGNDLKKAYQELADQEKGKYARRKANDRNSELVNLSPAVLAAKKVKEADDVAERARIDAEKTFDEAERRMSTELAREGARKALQTYDLREAAIRKAESASRGK